MSKKKVTEIPGGIRFAVRVQPRASCNEIVGWQGEALKVRLTAPPVEGKANQACLKFLADFFKVARRQVNLVGGLQSRQKIIEIADFTIAEFRQCLEK